MAASHHFSARSRSSLSRLQTNIKDADFLARLEQSFRDFLPVFLVAPMSAMKLVCMRLADPSVYPNYARPRRVAEAISGNATQHRAFRNPAGVSREIVVLRLAR